MAITLTIDIRADEPDWKELMPQITQTLLLGVSGHNDDDFQWTLDHCDPEVFDKEEVTCYNCDCDILTSDEDTPEEADAKAAGYCSLHCVNKHRGDPCPDDCQYCQDDQIP
jgi:hypothetical protein